MRSVQRLVRRLEQGLARARRQERGVALLLMAVNPEDKCSDDLELDLQSQLRCEDDLLAMGGPRLAVVAEDLRHVSDVFRISRRLQERAQRHGARLRMGISHAGPAYSEAATMVRNAESTLVEMHPEEWERLADPAMHAEARARIDLEVELGRALDRNELEVYYQPIVELGAGRVCGFEALVRWPHPEKGLLLPETFLNVAYEARLMLRLDRLVIRKSLECLRKWSDRYPVRMSVNVCSEHFTDPVNTDELLVLLKGSGAPLGHLRLDVSEEVVMDAGRQAALKRLREVNIGFHLDSYGVGSSSFACLRSFPFECLKLDRQLIFQMETEESCELIASLLKVASSMRMRTIAEGVATHAQLEELRGLGCREAQGFLFAPPVDEAEAAEILAQDPRW